MGSKIFLWNGAQIFLFLHLAYRLCMMAQCHLVYRGLHMTSDVLEPNVQETSVKSVTSPALENWGVLVKLLWNFEVTVRL